MIHPLHNLAHALDKMLERRRGRLTLEEVLRDPHRARDLGLPQSSMPPSGNTRW